MKPRILLVTSEAVPMAKTGGLADVITALAESLRACGIDASILMPGYPAAREHLTDVRNIGQIFDLPGGGGTLQRGFVKGSGVPVILLSTRIFRSRTGSLYVGPDGNEWPDNALAFADLAHATIAICEGRTALPAPHIVHCNDWHAGLVPALLKQRRVRNVASVTSIHNLAFQGLYPAEMMSSLQLPQSLFHQEGIEYWGKISFLKAAVRFADKVTTVSHTYAKEILTQKFGYGFEGILNARARDLVAIPNGIDMQLWDPARDPLLARRYSTSEMKGKAVCKVDLKRRFGLMPADAFAPVMGIGSRVTHQKMADVVIEAIPQILENHPRLQVAVLGCGEKNYEEGFQQLAERFAGRFGFKRAYDEETAHALHAGSDVLLHGSRFEPFGLTPLYAMRYGTIPIVSQVGGLCDTVQDAGEAEIVQEGATGISFAGDTPAAMIEAVARAFRCYANTRQWQKLQHNGMSQDFGWDGPAREYIACYASIAPPQAAADLRRAARAVREQPVTVERDVGLLIA